MSSKESTVAKRSLQALGVASAIGAGVLAVLLVLPRITKKIPAILVAVVGATVVTATLGLAAEGVATVGELPRGVPKPEVPWTDISDVAPLMLAAMAITLVSLTDTIATATSFASRRGEEVEPDQEMVGMGAANVAAGLFQGFAVSTSGSRTAVAEESGAKSQVTGVVGAGLVLILLLFLSSLLADLPQTALAAVVIAAAFTLTDLGALRRYRQVRKSALVISLVATAGVILFGVLQGIIVAVILAIFLFFRRNWWPHGAVLGEVEGLDGWHSTKVYPEARQVPGVVVYAGPSAQALSFLPGRGVGQRGPAAVQEDPRDVTGEGAAAGAVQDRQDAVGLLGADAALRPAVGGKGSHRHFAKRQCFLEGRKFRRIDLALLHAPRSLFSHEKDVVTHTGLFLHLDADVVTGLGLVDFGIVDLH